MINKKNYIKQTLPVVDRKSYPGREIFLVKYEGKEYAINLLKFQQEEPTPDTIDCLIENGPDGNPVIKRDLTPILSRLYKENETYDFIIDQDWTVSGKPRYMVKDGTGLWFYIYPHDGQRYSKGERVSCRVTRLRGMNINLQVVRRYDLHRVKPFDINEFNSDQWPLLKDLIENSEEFNEIRRLQQDGNSEWVFLMFTRLWSVIQSLRPSTLLDVEARDTKNAQLKGMTQEFGRMLTYFLEDSEYLNEFEEEEATERRRELTQTMYRVSDLIRAWEIVTAGNADSEIDAIFNKMRTSGYLIRPERRLRTMMYIFMLGGQELMNTKLPDLFKVILESGNLRDNWRAEPFRTALVEQLQLYIDVNRQLLDMATVIDDTLRPTWEGVVRALALQQFLADGEHDPVNHSANQSKLFRYYSLFSPTGGERFLDKAVNALLRRSFYHLDYPWDDISNLQRLWQRLMAVLGSECTTRVLDTPYGTLKVSPASISFSMPNSDNLGYQALPPYMKLWKSLSIELDEPLPSDLRNPIKIPDYKKTFSAIVHSIFDEKEVVAKVKETPLIRRLPDPDDEVEIIIEGIDPIYPERFRCRIVEDGVKGTGYILSRQIINIRRVLDPRIFRNYEGTPYILRAKVKSIGGEDEIEFTLLDGLAECVRDNFQGQDELQCVVLAPPSNRTRGMATGFSDDGFAVWLDPGDFKEELKDRAYVWAEVTNISSDGKNVYARVTSLEGEEKDYYWDGARRLIRAYSEERVWEDPELQMDSQDEAHEVEDLLSDEDARQIMHIVGRMGAMEHDLTVSYCYYSYAELIARLLGNQEMVKYFDTRRRIIELLDDFATNGRVDPDRLEHFTHSLAAGAAGSPEALKVRVLAMLDHGEYNDSLIHLMTDKDPVISQLAHMVLVYNMLDGLKMPDSRSAIRDRIYTLLNLKADHKPVQIENGRESNTVEFKTSIVYPAGRSHCPDMKEQLLEISKVVCGMLNSKGGKLYIGVSDEGYIRGVDSDVEVLGSLDKFDLTFHNALRKSLGFLVNESEYINTYWAEFGKKKVYVAEISPYTRAVACNDIYYQRHGTSTLYVPDSSLDEFLRKRNHEEVVPETVEAHAETPSNREPAKEATSQLNPTENHAVSNETVKTRDEEPESTYVDEMPEERESEIATTRLRPNVLHDYEPGYQTVHTYLYFLSDLSILASDYDLYREDDSKLALALNEEEASNYLMMVYDCGTVVRVPVDDIISDIDRGEGRLRKNDPVVFIAPCKEDTGLLIYFRDTSGNIFKQAFKSEAIDNGSVTDLGLRLVAKENEILKCELIDPDHFNSFSAFTRNGQKIGKDDETLAESYADSLRRLR